MGKPAAAGFLGREQQISPEMSAFSMIRCRGCQATQGLGNATQSHINATSKPPQSLLIAN
jgi:hypothetical protein